MNLSRLVNAHDEQPRHSSLASPPPDVPLPDSPDRTPSPASDTDDASPQSNPSLSFIVICEAREGGKVTYVSESVTDVLGIEPEEGIGRPAADFAHPDDAIQLYNAYQEMINEDKAACLLYLRIPHINPKIGYLLCSVTVSRVGHNLVGGVSQASSGVKAMYTASTAQEVYIIAPTAEQFQIRRWNDQGAPKPIQHPVPAKKLNGSGTARSRSNTLQHTPSPRSSEEPEPSSATAPARSPSPSNETVSSGASSVPDTPSLALERLSLDSEAPASVRVALILDRFSMHCTVMHITNADILPAGAAAVGRPFYDFVSPTDEEKVRAAMDTVKGWGVNERGHPSDGGFGFYRFRIVPKGRNSRAARPHEPRSRHGTGGANAPYDRRGSIHAAHHSEGNTENDITPPTSTHPAANGAASSRSRMLARTPSSGGGAGGGGPGGHGNHGGGRRRDEVTVDAIFSPQSDGIIVILRRNPYSGLSSQFA